MYRLLLALTLLLPPAATAAPPMAPADEPSALRLPAEVKSDKPLVVVRPETSAKVVYWRLPPGLCCDANEDGRKLTVASARSGSFTLTAIVAPEKDKVVVAETVVTFALGEPPPPAPPPTPPNDQLRRDLQTLYQADPSPTRQAAGRALAGVYKAAAKLARSPAVATRGEFLRVVGETADEQLKDVAALQAVRARVGAELDAARLPDGDDAALDAGVRDRLESIYSRAASALEDAAK